MAPPTSGAANGSSGPPSGGAPTLGTPTIVTIDGIDGSGKSTFADGLAAGLAREGWATVTLRVDDFRRPLDWTAAAGGPAAEADLYYDDYYDLDLLQSCLRAFLARVPRVTIPVFDPATERLDGVRELRLDGGGSPAVAGGPGGPRAVAVVEGVFALRVPAAAAGLIVYIDVPGGEARRRLMVRDLARGRRREIIEHRLAARYLPAQARYQRLFDPAGRADVVVDNSRPGAPLCVRRALTRADADLRAALDRLLPPAF